MFILSDIARELQIDRAVISRDMAYLRHKAQEKIKTHIEKTMPEEYQKGMVAIDQVLRMAWSIVNKTADERVRLQALALINDCNRQRTDMTTNGAIVKDALTYVNGKAQKLSEIAETGADTGTDADTEEEKEDYKTTVTAETETEGTTTNYSSSDS